MPAKGYKQSLGHRRKIREAMTGRTHTKETKAKISAAQTPERRRENGRLLADRNKARVWTDSQRSALSRSMAERLATQGLNKSGTAIERIVEARLLREGVVFQKQAKIDGDANHVWDFVVPSKRVLIEADGCYWHGCEDCGHSGMPTNLASDARKVISAFALGWKLRRVKECCPDLVFLSRLS